MTCFHALHEIKILQKKTITWSTKKDYYLIDKKTKCFIEPLLRYQTENMQIWDNLIF